jgi:hypothetical protein
MKNCTDCKYADWQRTATGRLHPSGDGKCTYKVEIPQLPACRVWLCPPSASYPFINRHRELKDHCPCYQEKGGDANG